MQSSKSSVPPTKVDLTLRPPISTGNALRQTGIRIGIDANKRRGIDREDQMKRMGQGFASVLCLVVGLSACGAEADGEDGSATEEVGSTSQALIGTDCSLEATSCF